MKVNWHIYWPGILPEFVFERTSDCGVKHKTTDVSFLLLVLISASRPGPSATRPPSPVHWKQALAHRVQQRSVAAAGGRGTTRLP